MPGPAGAQAADGMMGAKMQGQGPAREFEVKLEIPAQTVSKVMRLPWLWELASGELSASKLQSIYYDTPALTLRQRGVTLRVRRVGAARIQTLKSVANGAALPIERDEWEEEITGDIPDLKLLAAPLAGLPRKKLQRQLEPCFEIHVDRSAFPIQSANSSIEVAIDRAHIVGQDAASFCEIELELKRGASSEMARIARRIATEVPAALSLKTKAERGYALREREPPQPFNGEPTNLTSAARVGEAFQVIGWNCLRHFALNREAVLIGDLRAAHEMRRGLRRLDAAISIFDCLLDGPETDALTAELGWLTAELDPVCALDALLEGTLVPLSTTGGEAAALAALCDETAMRRQVALDQLKQELSGDRYRQLELRTALWIIAAEWSDRIVRTQAQPSRRITGFATQVLEDRAEKLRRRLRRFGHASGGKTAKLLRALRRMSKASGFFADLYPGARRRQRAYDTVLQKLRRDFGRLEEFEIHDGLREQFMKSWLEPEARANLRTPEKAYALGLAIGQQATDKAARLISIKQTVRELASTPPFWR
jgi:triphosphatase